MTVLTALSLDAYGDYVTSDTGALMRRNGGLHWVIAAFFVVADLVGSGIVAMPKAIAETGYWYGLLALFIVTLIMLGSAILLGRSWNIMLRNYPVYRTHCRKPYAAMGYRVGGTPLRIAASMSMLFTNFGASVVFLILCAKNIDDFLRVVFHKEPGLCVMIIILGICILPITLLKSPQNFPGIVTIGMSATIMAMSAICIGALLDLNVCTTRKFPELRIDKIWVMLGTLMFSFGGHGTFPTIQHDMRWPNEFTKSSYLSFTIILILYSSVSAVGAWTYGDAVGASIIDSIKNRHIQQAINLLIMLHCFLTTTLILNPVNQEVEDLLNIPHVSVVKRVMARSLVMLLVTLTALSLPTFNLILGIIGGSTIMFSSLFFPPVFYLFLNLDEKPSSTFITTPDENLIVKNWRKVILLTDKMTLFVCTFIIVFGLVAGTAATYTSLLELISSSSIESCFWTFASRQKAHVQLKFHNLTAV